MLSEATSTDGVICSRDRVTDIVFGRYGFDSLSRDGFVIRLRGPAPLYLQMKERLADEMWRETSFPVENRDAVNHFLERVGFTPYLVIDRERHSIRSRFYNVCFDRVEDLGMFVEVELLDKGEGYDCLEGLVERLRALPKLPPYGDIIRSAKD
jgi:adenylate cyclase class IV